MSARPEEEITEQESANSEGNLTPRSRAVAGRSEISGVQRPITDPAASDRRSPATSPLRRLLSEVRWSDLAIALAITIAVAGATAGVIELMTHVVGPRLLTHFGALPALESVPKRTTNARGAAADPLNVALVGTETEVREALRRAGWREADPVTHGTSIKIAESVLLRRPDSTAPLSPLYLYGRMQDLAFEREVGRSASRRHHVRLWQSPTVQYGGRPVWLGGATFDLRAGLSHRGFHPTHHIAPDVDEERDTLAANLVRAEQVAAMFRVTGLGVRVDAHNAEGDRFDTDGEMRVLVLSPANAPHAAPAEPPAPLAVRIKDRIWSWFHHH